MVVFQENGRSYLGRGDLKGALWKFIKDFQRTAQKCGLKMPDPQEIAPICNFRDHRDIEKHLAHIHHEFMIAPDKLDKELNFLLCIMPRKDAHLYAAIKYYSGET